MSTYVNSQINKYRILSLKVLLLIYISGTFNLQAFEALHFIMHLDEIVQLDYTHHNHSHDDSQSIAHDHNGVLDHVDSDFEEDEQSVTKVPDKKVELRNVVSPHTANHLVLNRKVFADQLIPDSNDSERLLRPPRRLS